jgi:hypothetical protein
VLDAGKYAFQKGPEADAKFNLALMNLITALPLLQEQIVKAAIVQYMSTPQMKRIELERQKRRSPSQAGGGSGGGGSGGGGITYYMNPDDPMNNPGVVKFAADRNIWPSELLAYDSLAVLAREPLANLMGSEPLAPLEERVPDLSATPAPAEPQAAPEPPQKPVANYVPALTGSPSQRLATSLGKYKGN